MLLLLVCNLFYTMSSGLLVWSETPFPKHCCSKVPSESSPRRDCRDVLVALKKCRLIQWSEQIRICGTDPFLQTDQDHRQG